MKAGFWLLFPRALYLLYPQHFPEFKLQEHKTLIGRYLRWMNQSMKKKRVEEFTVARGELILNAIYA
jgi:hypothetical protein